MKSNNVINMASLLVTKAEIERAALESPPYVVKPEERYLDYFSQELGCNLSVLCTHEGPIRSFKDRGAFHKIKAIVSEHIKTKGLQAPLRIVAASEGNHSQGVAKAVAYFAAKYPTLPLVGTVFMSAASPQAKRDKTIALGKGNIGISVVGGMFDNANAKAMKLANENDGTFYVATFDDKAIITGQGTVCTTIEGNYNMVLVGLGGGGLAAGLASYYQNSETDIIGVQPAWVASMIVALCNGKPTLLDGKDVLHRAQYPVLVDGATIGLAGVLPHDILAKDNARVDSVSARQIAYVFKKYVENHATKPNGEIDYHRVPELAGILSLVDVYRMHAEEPSKVHGKNILCVFSGGNISKQKVGDLLEFAKSIPTFPLDKVPFYDPANLEASKQSLSGWVKEGTLTKSWADKYMAEQSSRAMGRG